MTYVKFFREEPAPYFASDEEHFLFGSVGTEEQQGIPYWIWLVLPRVFPEYLPRPGGYASTGMLSKDGHEMPIGLSKVTIGFPRVAINCAMCHTASFRAARKIRRRSCRRRRRIRPRRSMYLRFLFACASDPRFTADTLMAEIAQELQPVVSRRDALSLRHHPADATALLRLRDSDAWMQRTPEWGRGRIDPFNPVKFGILEQPIDQTIGNSDMVPLWNLKQHEGYAYHWDGLNPNLQEVVLSSALGDGATQKWVDRDFAKWNNTKPEEMSSLRRVENYIMNVQPPKYPFPIDFALAAEGESVYKTGCASCHAVGGARTGKVIPFERDRHGSPSSRHVDAWRRQPPTTPTARATPGSFQHSGRLAGTCRCHSRVCGCARLTCTTGRCRRSLISWRKRHSGRCDSGAGTTCTIPRAWAS